jgi:hypothetical protein
MATADVRGIAALIGPVHGIAWLFGIIATWRDPRRTTGIAVLATIPGIGGMLALRALDRAEAHPRRPSTWAGPADSGRNATRDTQYEGIHDDIAQ